MMNKDTTQEDTTTQISPNKKEDNHGAGWLTTYADMMTLLFAFFVMLYAMSSPDPVKLSQIEDAMEKESGRPGSLQSLSEIKEELEKIVNELNMESTTNILSDPRGLILQLKGDICFLSGSTDIKEELEAILQVAAKKILNNKLDFRMVVVEGHTDSDPITGDLKDKFPTNWELSASRAASVVNYLIDNGVNSGRLQASGYADRWPAEYSWAEVKGGKISQAAIVEANATKTQKRNNRRIKIVFTNN